VPSLRFEGRVPNEKKNSWSSVGRRENVSREPSGLIVKIYPLPIDLNLYSRNGVNLPYRGSLCADYTYMLSVIHQPTADSNLRLRIDKWSQHERRPLVLRSGTRRGFNDDCATDLLRW